MNKLEVQGAFAPDISVWIQTTSSSTDHREKETLYPALCSKAPSKSNQHQFSVQNKRCVLMVCAPHEGGCKFGWWAPRLSWDVSPNTRSASDPIRIACMLIICRDLHHTANGTAKSVLAKSVLLALLTRTRQTHLTS